MIRNFAYIILIYLLTLSNALTIEPEIFVQSTVNRASKILGENLTKEKKI